MPFHPLMSLHWGGTNEKRPDYLLGQSGLSATKDVAYQLTRIISCPNRPPGS
jgi:hypothetical protein